MSPDPNSVSGGGEAAEALGAFLRLTNDAPELPTAYHTAAGPDVSPPREPAGYELLGELGRGGMGIVYKARQTSLNRTVALKMVLSAHYATAEALSRFKAEAEALAALHHPGIVQVIDVGSHEGRPYFSMEYVGGPSLAQFLARRLPHPRTAAALVAEIADAVRHAHEAGILHRDLKPANVLLAGDDVGVNPSLRPKVTDFGLAKREEDDSHLTRSGAVMGTPSYMPPEQATGDLAAVGPHSDVYSLGAVLYECLTGKPPFRAPSLAETLEQVRRDDPVPPSRLQAGVPRDLEVICLKCLRKDQAARYASAGELADDLRRFLAGEAILARPLGPVERLRRWCRRYPAVATLSALCAALLAAGVAGVLYEAAEARGEARKADIARKSAEDAEAAAVAARDRAKSEFERADEAGREATRKLVRLHVATGSNAVEAGDLLTGMLWYGRAWRTDAGLGSTDGPHRMRVGGILAQLPVLEACFFHERPLRDVRHLPGGRLLCLDDDRSAYVHDPAVPANPPVVLTFPDAVSRVAVSPACLVAAACADGSCDVRSLPDGRPVQAFAHRGAVTWAAFAPDGRRLATACADGFVRVFDVLTGRRVGPTIRATAASFVGFDPDGARLLVATDRNVAAVFDAESGAAVSPSVRHYRRHLRVRGEQFGSNVDPSFSPDGKTFAAAWNGPVVYKVEGGAVVDRLDYGGNTVRRMEFSPDGSRVLVQSLNTPRWWMPDAEGAARDRWRHPRESWVGSVSPDGKLAATASSAGLLHLWETATGKEVVRPMRHVGEILAVAFSPAGGTVAAVSTDGTLRVWRPVNDALAPKTVPADDTDGFVLHRAVTPVRRVVPSRDGRFRLTVDFLFHVAELTRADTGKRILAVERNTPAVDYGFTADGRVMYLAGADAVDIYDAAAGRKVATVPISGGFVGVASSRTPPVRVLLTDGVQAQVIDFATGARVAGPFVQTAAEHPEWGPASGSGYGMQRGDISPDGRLALLPGGAYRMFRRYDLDRGKSRDLALHDGFVYRAMFSGDGRRALSCASDNTARLFDPADGSPLGPALWHPGFVRDATLSDDGRTAVTLTAAPDRSVRLWDAGTGDLLLPPMRHPSLPDPLRVRFSGDGRRVLSTRADGTAIRWELPSFAVAEGHVPALIELFAARRIDRAGGLASLTDDDVRGRVAEFRRAYEAYRAARGVN